MRVSQSPAKARQKPKFDAWLAEITPTYEWNAGHLVEIRRHLDRITNGDIKRLALFLPPRHGKSAMTTVRYIAWRIECNPALRVIVGAYNQELAELFSRQIRRIVRERGVTLSDERKTASEWETVAGGGVKAAGVGSGVTGRGAELVVIDDPVKSREEANSTAYRNRCWDWYTNDLYTRLEPNGAIILIQTRWHEDDLAGRILQSEQAGDWQIVNLPAEAETDDVLGRAIGDPLWPERFTKDDLQNIRQVIGSWSYTALYQQRPLPAGGGLFKREWFQIVDAAPVEAHSVRYWDKAGTAGAGDYSVGLLLARTTEGLYYVTDVQRGQWSSHQRNQIMHQTAELDGQRVPIWIEQEAGSGGKESAELSVRQLAGFNVRTETVTGSKETRAMPFAAQCEAGNVKLVRASWNAALLDELSSFPSGTHDDIVDAAAGAFAKLAAARTVKLGWL